MKNNTIFSYSLFRNVQFKVLKQYRLTLLSVCTVLLATSFTVSADTTLPNGSYLGIVGQVVSNGNGNLNSIDSIATGDTVQWSSYFQSKLSSPFASIGVMDLPAGFKWVNGSIVVPPNITLAYKVSGSTVFTSTEPANGTVVTQVQWTINPLVKIDVVPTVLGAIDFTGTGDGFRVIPYKNNLYVVNHHIGANYVNCRVSTTGLACPGFTTNVSMPTERNNMSSGGVSISPVNGVAAVPNMYPTFITPLRSIEHLDRTNGNMYTYGAVADSVKVLCLNLDTLRSCANEVVMGTTGGGETAEFAVNPLGSVGSKYYATLRGNNKILCYDTVTQAACVGSPYNTFLTNRNDSAPGSYVQGTKIYLSADNILKCFETTTAAPCSGWYTNPPWWALPDMFSNASIFPYLNTDGSFKGICSYVVVSNIPNVTCRTEFNALFLPTIAYTTYLSTNGGHLHGRSPDNGHGAEFSPVVFGTRVFQAKSIQDAPNYATCFDFATNSPCFTIDDTDTTRSPQTYSVIKDPIRANCLWTLGDRPISKSFDPRDGSICPPVTSFPPAILLDVNPLAHYQCDGSKASITSWGQIRFSPALAWGGATGITAVNAKIMDSSGVILPAAFNPNRSYTSGTYNLDISDIPFTTYPSLKVEITVEAGNQPVSLTVGFDVTWVGDPVQFCFKTVAPAITNCQIDVSVVQNNTAINTTNTEQLNANTGLTPGRTDSGYGPGVSTTTLRQYPKGSSDPTQVLQTRYNLNNFTGDLVQYELLADSSLSPAPISSASAVAGTRTLYTSAPNQTGRLTAVSFSYNNLSAAQKAVLNRNLNNVVDTKGQNRFDYLSGTRTSELANGGTLRTRTNIFGPVIDSSPVTLMKNVLTGYNDDKYPRYTEFRKRTVRRNTLSLYASNDGMLHAYKVDPIAGLSQVFSYLPSTILDETTHYTDATLADLRKNPYWLDNTPMLADVHLGDVPTDEAKWRTVVVGNQGRGGRGVYALDITNGDLSPATTITTTATSSTITTNTTTADRLLFEYNNTTHSDLVDLGYIISQPSSDKVTGSDQIARMSDGRWAYITGNGINSNLGDAINSGTGKAVLYIFYMNNQSPTGKPKWRKYSVNTSGTTDNNLDFNNGLSTPRPVDIDGDGNIDLIYAGDIKGNLWRFDVRNLNAVTVTKIFKTANSQPIYTAPVVTKLPAASKQLCPENKLNECLMVSFGTGELYNPLGSTNIKNITPQAFYGVYDIADIGTTALVLDAQLVAQTIGTLTTFTGASSRSITNNSVVYGPTKTGIRGWKLTLSAAEHTSANPTLVNGRVIFASARPTGAPNAACAPGDGWLTVIDLAQGSSNDSSSIGIPITGNIEVISKASRTNDNNTIFLPSALAPLPANTMTKYCPPNTTCTPDKKNLVMPTISGRMSWREVFGLPK